MNEFLNYASVFAILFVLTGIVGVFVVEENKDDACNEKGYSFRQKDKCCNESECKPYVFDCYLFDGKQCKAIEITKS